MLSPCRPTSVLLLLCLGTVDVSGAHNGQFRRRSSGFIGSPSKSVSANSAVQCGAKCTATKTPFCDGFTYRADGVCQLYSDQDVCEVSDLAQEEEGAGGTGSFRRRGTEACPGTEVDPCGCPDGFQRCGGRCYAVPEQKANFTQAEEVCSGLGGHLATQRTPAERQCGPTVTLGIRGLYYIGGGKFHREDDPFRWLDGCGAVPLTKELWRPGQPSGKFNGFVENCLSNYLGVWNDLSCFEQCRPICQLANCYQAHCQ